MSRKSIKSKKPAVKFLRRLPPGPHPEWAEEYRARRPMAEIAIRYGVTLQAVWANLRRQGVKIRPRGHNRITPSEAQKNLWARAAERGLVIAEIRALKGNRHSAHVIQKSLREMGIQTRRPYGTTAGGKPTRGKQCYDMRLAGKPWPQIAREMSLVSPARAFALARQHAGPRQYRPALPFPIRT